MSWTLLQLWRRSPVPVQVALLLQTSLIFYMMLHCHTRPESITTDIKIRSKSLVNLSHLSANYTDTDLVYNSTITNHVAVLPNDVKTPMLPSLEQLSNLTSQERMSLEVDLNKQKRIVFIGGCPRSGTTLMRTMLDSHSTIACGPETRVIPRVLGLYKNWVTHPSELRRLLDDGVTENVLHAAIRSFIVHIIHGLDPQPGVASRPCVKDPMNLTYIKYLVTMFPNAKFIHMVRDCRAVAFSIIDRNVRIVAPRETRHRQHGGGKEESMLSTLEEAAQFWSNVVSHVHRMCKSLPSACLEVRYEDLVRDPLQMSKRILQFLGEPFEESLLRHHEHAHKLGKLEPTTKQVQQPIHQQAIERWRSELSHDQIDSLNTICESTMRAVGYKL
eukprot:GILJ01015124.1.p1 GENE.GILJ01015124.1~~GILJ01015124.1.p1  ORF type:complete len:387 (+),score=41.34 GILJ01015124.1:50-1210(+)